MTGDMSVERFEAIQARVRAAHDMVHALCRPRGNEGARDWVMSIPARLDDPDIVIGAALRDVDRLLEAVAHLSREEAGRTTLHELYFNRTCELEAEIKRLKDALRGVYHTTQFPYHLQSEIAHTFLVEVPELCTRAMPELGADKPDMFADAQEG